MLDHGLPDNETPPLQLKKGHGGQGAKATDETIIGLWADTEKQ